MPAVLDENTQYLDSAGKPLVSGKVYFGVQNADPTVSPITIYSDRELATPIANPQILDALGRATNKVWVPGRYSMRVDDLNDSQIYQELDNGESADKGITVLEGVSGGNTITATAASTITAYEDLEQYTFRTASVNTAAVTLNIDTVGAKSVVKNHDQPILPGDFEADQNVIVSYNLTDDVFEWTNQNAATVTFYEAPNVVAAATTDIWAGDGNTVKITGNTGITSFGTAPNEGAIMWVTFSGTPTLTHSANLNLQGAANYTAAAGDFMKVYADSTTQFDVQIFKADGTAVVAPVVGLVQEVSAINTTYSTTTTQIPGDDTIPQNTEGSEFLTLAITPTSATNRLEIEVTFPTSYSNTGSVIAIGALFQDTTADALAAIYGSQQHAASTARFLGPLKHIMVAGTTSETTFKVRIGPDRAATLGVNGSNSGRKLGGVSNLIMTIKEYTV